MKDSIRAWLTGQFGEDEDLFADIYGQYATDMKAQADRLAALLAAGNAAELGEIGHAMKGMALQIGDSELAEPCMRLQVAGRAAEIQSCAAVIPLVRDLVAAL